MRFHIPVCIMNDNGITVVVPTYNHETLIVSAIESIVRQTVFGECRVIVSDDCSTDNTYELAQIVCRHHANIVVRRNKKNMGVMKHYQHLASEIATPYTAILEGDDKWLTAHKLEAQRKFLDCHSDVQMCFSACIVEFEATSTAVEHPPWNDGRNRLINVIDLLYDNPVATFSNCFYRSPAFKDAIGSVHAGGGYDWLCTLKIASRSPIGFLSEPSTLYRVHQDGTWSGLSRSRQRYLIFRTLQLYREPDTTGLAPFIEDAMSNIP